MEVKKRNWKRFIIFLLVLLLIGGGIYFGAVSFFNTPEEKKAESITPTQEPTPTEEVSPTPEESPTPEISKTPTSKPTANPVDKTTGLDRSKLSVEVQNGSGQAGVANKGSDFLKSLGYKVAGIGNADNYNYEGVAILVKSDFSKYLSLLKTDLSSQYTVSSTSAVLSASSSADAVVIIGK
ncbi:MAG: LytR C-terminal domain-containing protein [Candidatus Levyibacteriota bacterium]|nr:MAG: LytR C-terminal domain-containing protein [Candidatus Levybacteria bacterium]